MALLTCFLHPRFGFEQKTLDDLCPEEGCGRPYRFPLDSMPTTIGDYQVDSAIDRGFYAATYRARVGPLKRQVVLKVAPVALYKHKDFAAECQQHAAVAAGTEHLVKIQDYKMDLDVTFGDVLIRCHVAELEPVNGPTLDKFLADDSRCTTFALAQIAIDLFRLLQELEQHEMYHNDLHANNMIVETLDASRRRPDAVEGLVRAVAIDLGSASDDDRRDADHVGDSEAVISHLFRILSLLLRRQGTRSDLDYRIALTLEDELQVLNRVPAHTRVDHELAIRRIRTVCDGLVSPWQRPPGLARFADAYNAQQMHAWFVPRLLVDPEGEWLTRITIRGPQVITGIRGCGKTMLLRALQSHARIFAHETGGGRVDEGLQADGYVGLYVSSSRLLDPLGKHDQTLHEPYSRLFVAYTREAIRALMHLKALPAQAASGPLVAHDAHQRLAHFVATQISNCGQLEICQDLRSLEIELQSILNSLERGESQYVLGASPTVAFPDLAEAVVGCSATWSGCQVFFLLDDVSTRHLALDAVGQLMSRLLFSSPGAAFKFTTELQTLERALQSLALIESGSSDREFDIFDLGAAVNARLRDTESGVQGTDFLARILQARAQHSSSHPDCTPQQLLGDKSLESVAALIVGTTSNSARRKGAYQGLRALTALCVGDLGDVIKIYESIVRRAEMAEERPASGRTQTEAIREHAARRLFNLRRRTGDLKTYATEFAKASHELMLRSSQAPPTTGSKHGLRQYNSIYVRLDQDSDADFAKVMELLDAGVFALEGGTESPRSKTRDSNPVLQFKLTFRKLLGIHNFIGLAERDRFELSGSALHEYLTEPSRGREILMRNLGGRLSDAEMLDDPAGLVLGDDTESDGQFMLPLEATEDDRGLLTPQPLAALPDITPSAHSPQAREFDIGAAQVDVLILGLGFEDRALESAKRLLASTTPQQVVLLRYDDPGHAQAIEQLLALKGTPMTEIRYAGQDTAFDEIHMTGSSVCIDVTALTKPAIHHLVQLAVQKASRVLVAHTRAESYYPTDDDITAALSGAAVDDETELLDALTALHTGESRTYRFDRLQSETVDESRSRILVAAVTAKHQRLQALLGVREYDGTVLICPLPGSPRSELAHLATRVELGEQMGDMAYAVGTDDLVGQIEVLSRLHQKWYLEQEHLVELALTGSKLNAVACALVASALPVSTCWYVAPDSYDAQRFTHGVGESRLFELRLDRS